MPALSDPHPTNSDAWSSGGSENVQDLNNPWFLSNTKTVRYCLKVDETNFAVSEDALAKTVSEALAYWKAEFALAPVLPWHGIEAQSLRLATQDFMRSPCTADVDLVFQFGYLSEEQIQKIGDPTRYFALSMRTEYNRVDMKGKGFIYVSPESGPLKPRNDRTVDHPWSKHPVLLYKALVHELGHVFGLQHKSSVLFAEMDLMNPSFVESILLKSNSPADSKEDLPGFFTLNEKRTRAFFAIADDGREILVARRFFGVPNTVKAVFFQYRDGVFTVYSGDEEDRVLGTARLEDHKNTSTLWTGFLSGILQTRIVIWLPSEQKVFPQGLHLTLSGPMQQKSVKKGIYKSADGAVVRPLTLVLSPDGSEAVPVISGLMDGQVFSNIIGGF